MAQISRKRIHHFQHAPLRHSQASQWKAVTATVGQSGVRRGAGSILRFTQRTCRPPTVQAQAHPFRAMVKQHHTLPAIHRQQAGHNGTAYRSQFLPAQFRPERIKCKGLAQQRCGGFPVGYRNSVAQSHGHGYGKPQLPHTAQHNPGKLFPILEKCWPCLTKNSVTHLRWKFQPYTIRKLTQPLFQLRYAPISGRVLE